MFENICNKLNISQNVIDTVKIKTDISFLSAFDSVISFSRSHGEKTSGEIVIITSDSGYFSAGRELRESLKNAGKEVSVFCADDGGLTRDAVKDFLNSVPNADFAVVIGDGNLYKTAMAAPREKKLPVVFVPTGCEIGSAFCVCEKNGDYCFFDGGNPGNDVFCEPDLIVFDERIIEKNSNKYKNYSACCYAESVRLINLEADIICAVGLKNGGEKSIACEINGLFGQICVLLNSYYSRHEYKTLFFACIVAGVMKRYAFLTNVGDAAWVFAETAARYARAENSSGGELELYSAQIFILLYENFLRSDYCANGNFIPAVPDALSASLKIEKDLGVPFGELPELPPYFYNDGELSQVAGKIFNNDEVLNIIIRAKNAFTETERKLKSVYGGKRREARTLSEKNKIDALNVTPFLISGDCLFKIICACGCADMRDF